MQRGAGAGAAASAAACEGFWAAAALMIKQRRAVVETLFNGLLKQAISSAAASDISMWMIKYMCRCRRPQQTSGSSSSAASSSSTS